MQKQTVASLDMALVKVMFPKMCKKNGLLLFTDLTVFNWECKKIAGSKSSFHDTGLKCK